MGHLEALIRATNRLSSKLSRTSEGQAALEHEYSIYEHLSTLRTPLKGIPPCLGLFDGDESEQSALILGDCGQTLALRTGRYEPAVTVSNIERSGYLRILDGLHAADVLHGDLRTWNMLIDDDGQPALIDFDRARRNPSQDDIVKERARLVKLLDGFPVDDDSFVSHERINDEYTALFQVSTEEYVRSIRL
ncbi:hypothetical protein BDZ89DRAFT_423309 [Hymenopellis radicata]|nr:hypothetical protein BDZ89DRAFT_423309 [Hymenopellis radicata]